MASPALRFLVQVVRELVAHEAVGGLEAAVEVEGGEERLVRVRPERGLHPAPRLLLAPAEDDELGQPQLARAPGEARRGDELSPRLALAPLRPLGIPAVQEVGHHETDHRVPQELEGLVVTSASGHVLVGAAAVGEGAVEEPEVRESIAQPQLERVQLVLAVLRHGSRPNIAQATLSRTRVMSSC